MSYTNTSRTYSNKLLQERMTSKKSKLNPTAPIFIPSSLFKIPSNGFTEKDVESQTAAEDTIMKYWIKTVSSKENQEHTYWRPDDIEDVPSKHRELPVEIQQAQSDALNSLKKNEVFKKGLTAFLEKEYCLHSIDIEKGCRIDLDIRGVFSESYVLAGKKKKHIAFWFNYKQDAIIYGIVYECDIIDDPTTGWFFQNRCDEECGGTCSLFECAIAYQRV